MEKKTVSQQMEINEGFTTCYHNKFVQRWEVKSDYDIQYANSECLRHRIE